jgi:hypothetical protein
MFRRKQPAETLDHNARSSHRAMDLCCAIMEDAEDARRFALHRPGAMDLHNVVPFASSEIRHGSTPLPSELTSLVA